MKSGKKCFFIILLIIGLNFTVIPSIFQEIQTNSTSLELNIIEAAEDESVVALKADYVWENLVDSSGNPLTGEGVVIGMIDTGIDYKHPDFFAPNWTETYSTVAGNISAFAADLNDNGAGDVGEDLYYINSWDGPAAWDSDYDWLYLDRNANSAFDYGIDTYAVTWDENEDGDLTLGETVTLLSNTKIREIIDMTTGLNWTSADIESGAATTKDNDGHGTNIAGIAVGGQLKQDGKRFHIFTGVAPGAELIIIKIGDQSKGLYNDSWLYQALWMLSEKPVDIISLSLGAYMWRHLDDTSLIEQLIDSLDCPVVVSAGNLQNKHIHKEEFIVTGMVHPVPFEVSQYAAEPSNIRLSIIWDQVTVPLDVNLSYYGPVGGWVPWPGPGPHPVTFWPTMDYISLPNPNPVLQTTFFPILGTRIDYWLSTSSKTRMICINITRGGGIIAPGTYSVDIYNSPADLTTQCYVWDDSNQFVNATYPYAPGSFPAWVIFGFEATAPPNPQVLTWSTPEYTVTHPATADNAIAVGAYDLPTGDLAAFSSLGSTAYNSSMDGYQKPDLCAPGADSNTFGINSSVSRDAMAGDDALWTSHVNAYSGTSQAAPHVAGTIALMLQRNHTLTVDRIKTILRQTTTRDGFVGSVPNNNWGYGKLNITRAVQTVRLPSDEGGFPFLILGIVMIMIVIIILVAKKKKKKRNTA